MVSYWQYLIFAGMKMTDLRKYMSRRGNHWCTCVSDGEALFLDHHVA
jgi:hypothetical protein